MKYLILVATLLAVTGCELTPEQQRDLSRAGETLKRQGEAMSGSGQRVECQSIYKHPAPIEVFERGSCPAGYRRAQ